jgi:rhamnose utilization protein RhaD (predicted bifunctional aldolase and dehydrogenase)
MSVTTSQALEQLISMSCELGRPENDLAIYGEGNTSALEGEDRFWVKVSGSQLNGIDANGFALLDRAKTEALLDRDLRSDQEILAGLLEMRVDGGTRYPSVETMMHAFLLGLPGVKFVGHTHPTSLNSILCSVRAKELATLRIFPEQLVVCGISPVWVPYADPGLALACKVRECVKAWMTENGGTVPRSIILQNHGLFALGSTPREILSNTMMWQKTARVILGAMACGGVNFLPDEQVIRLATRPEEKLREQVIFGKDK